MSEPTLPTAPAGPGFGKLALASAAGNFIFDAVKSFLGPKNTTAEAPAGGWPTWPPADLLVATGPGVLFNDPSWEKPQVLTPITYHQHQLYLCVEEGLTVVLRQLRPGTWQYVRTLGELALLAVQPPLSGIQALLARSAATDAPA